MQTILRTVLATVVIALVAPATAAAAVTIGQSPPQAGAPNPACGPVPQTQDLIQITNTTGHSYAVPAGGGVITSWRSSTSLGTAHFRLRLFRPAVAGVTPVAESASETLTPVTSTFPARIPVSGGELLGFTVPANNLSAGCIYEGTGAPGDAVNATNTGPLGVTAPFAISADTGALLNVSATLEPDADRDGYGDETQDGCPTDPATHGACPAPPAIDNAFTIGSTKRNKRQGTAQVTVIVPDAGVLKLAGKNIAKRRTEKAAAGKAKLTVKPKGRAKRKLKRKGTAKLKATITFTPTGGEAAVQTTKVKLKLAG